MTQQRLSSDRKAVYSQAEEAAQRAEDLAGLEVSPATPGAWLAAVHGHVKVDVPRVATDLVVQLSAAVPEEWSLA